MRNLRIFLSVLLLLSVFSLPAFSQAEDAPLTEADLASLSKSALIAIILDQDQTLIEIEKESQNQENLWSQKNALLISRETRLNERESSIRQEEIRQGERESSLEVREQILAESLTLQNEAKAAQVGNSILSFGLGAAAGFIGGILLE